MAFNFGVFYGDSVLPLPPYGAEWDGAVIATANNAREYPGKNVDITSSDSSGGSDIFRRQRCCFFRGEVGVVDDRHCCRLCWLVLESSAIIIMVRCVVDS